MKIIITENQKKSLILESQSRRIMDSYKNMERFAKKVISEASEQTGLDFGFLMSWGATLGGLMMPVAQFMEGKNPELSSLDLSLLLTGAMVTYYTSNKKSLGKLLDLIKERGLVKSFDELLFVTEKLKTTFLSFIESLNITMSKLSNMLAYTFIIPILPQLYQMAQEGYNQDSIIMVVKRLSAYGIIAVSSIALKNLISGIVKRFKS